MVRCQCGSRRREALSYIPLSVATLAASIRVLASVVRVFFFALCLRFFGFVHSSFGGAADRGPTLSVIAGDKLGLQQLLVAAVLGSFGDPLPEGARLAG